MPESGFGRSTFNDWIEPGRPLYAKETAPKPQKTSEGTQTPVAMLASTDRLPLLKVFWQPLKQGLEAFVFSVPRPQGELAMDAKLFLQTVIKACISKRRIESCGGSEAWHRKKYGTNPRTDYTNADFCHCGKHLTEKHVRVAAKLAYYRANDPKHRLLAKAAGCCTGTVVRALERLRLLSLLSWDRVYLVSAKRAWRHPNRYALGVSRESLSMVFTSSANLIPKRFLLTQDSESKASATAVKAPKTVVKKTLEQIAAEREANIAAAYLKRRVERRLG